MAPPYQRVAYDMIPLKTSSHSSSIILDTPIGIEANFGCHPKPRARARVGKYSFLYFHQNQPKKSDENLLVPPRAVRVESESRMIK